MDKANQHTSLHQQNFRYMLECALKNQAIRALTLTQPWASLVASGVKKQETRSWPPCVRLEAIAIHAAKGFGAGDEASCYRQHFREALQQGGYQADATQRSRKRRWNFAFGHIIAIAWLRDVYQLSPLVFKSDLPSEPERSFGNYRGGRYIWLLPYVYRLKTPIPVRGHQLLWNWTPTDGFREEIREALVLHDKGEADLSPPSQGTSYSLKGYTHSSQTSQEGGGHD